MSEELGRAATATLRAMIGEQGVAEDSGIMAAQLQRAARILERPPISFGGLWEQEPANHPAALLRLAPEAAK